MELYAIVAVLALLQVKHWIVDFVLQTPEMVVSKGIYGDEQGMIHALQHAICTFFIMLIICAPVPALLYAGIDFVLHYHIDWIKVKYGCRDIADRLFWNHLGLDQMMHQLTYIMIVFLAVK